MHIHNNVALPINMTRPKILFIIFLLFLTSRAKPFKEVTPSELVNENESIAFYIKDDDILSISEFNRLYNPGENHFNNVQFIQEIDNDYVESLRSKNIKGTLEIPKLEEFNIENKTDKNVDATIVDSEEISRDSKSEGLLSDTKEVESTIISIKGKPGKEGYEDDFEVPENIESTEKYLKINITNSDSLVEIMPQIQSRRSLLPIEKPLLGTKVINQSVDIVDVDQDAAPKSDVISSEKPNDQSKVENMAESPVVMPQLIHPDPDVSDKQFNKSSPLLTLGTTGPADLKKMSNAGSAMFGDDYKQSNKLNKPEKIITKEKTIDDFNSNIYENAYPYTPSNFNSVNRQPLLKQRNFNSLYSKLPQASGHPVRNRIVPIGQSMGNYGTIFPNFNLQNRNLQNRFLQNRYLQNVGLYNIPRTRRFFSCNHCGQNEHNIHIH